MNEIFEEGLETRFARHEANNKLIHEWVTRHGFEFFAPEGYRSKSLTCVKNNRGIDVAAFVKTLKTKHSCAIDGGYGKLKGETFRISNMGDETEATMKELIGWLDDSLPA